jgi:hypothetical protein
MQTLSPAMETRPGDSRLDARVRSYELAAAMQLTAPEALGISDEPEHILKLYGLDRAGATYPAEINTPEETEYFGRKCLVARRLLERGVRFVQIWSGNDNGFPRRNWIAMRISLATIGHLPKVWLLVPQP